MCKNDRYLHRYFNKQKVVSMSHKEIEIERALQTAESLEQLERELARIEKKYNKAVAV